MDKPLKDWRASWIWYDGEASPRNEWHCFRRTFDVPVSGWQEASISVTADSRYALYVNGEQIGRGPVRSWPHELAYDTYDIRPWLKPGQSNTVALMVMHYGLSTFSYIRGRGGLLAQIEWTASEEGEQAKGWIGTDGAWRTERHQGYLSRSPRMSLQLAFAEWVNAGLWDEQWCLQAYDDSNWAHAVVIGEVGMAPWVQVIPRDIPYLTEERIYLSRIESLHQVTPLSWTAYLDARSILVSDSASHGNSTVYAGHIGTIIRMSEQAKITIGFAYVPPFLHAICVDGIRYPKSSLRGQGQDLYLDVDLQIGEHLVLFELAGSDHGRGIFMGIDCDVPFEVISPVNAGEAFSPFIAIGPIECYEYIDHVVDEQQKAQDRLIQACAGKQALVTGLDESSRRQYEAFCSISTTSSIDEVFKLGVPIAPASLAFVSPESVYTLTLWKKRAVQKPVPASLQQAVMAHAAYAEIPSFGEDDTEFIIDFGTEWSGYLSFEVDAGAGTVIDFFGVEYMHEGKVHYTHYLDNSLRYICREGRQTYTSQVRRGFRYVIVTVRKAPRAARLYSVNVLQSNYPVAEVGQFRCSDARLNEIWEMSRHTVKLCMEDTYVDCPAYEQTFWVGDSRNEALITYYLFGSEPLVKRCLDLVPGSSVQTPLYADQVPSGWSSVIPNWTFFWVIACHEYVIRTGDIDYAREMWPHVMYTLEHYEQLLDASGLLNIQAWNFLDWAPMDQPRNGTVTHQNMFLVKAFRSASQLSSLAGMVSEEKRFTQKADALQQAIENHLWSEERQAYLDCVHDDGRRSEIFSMQTQVVAYLCDIASGERQAQLERYLDSPPEAFVKIGSPFMSFFYYEALMKMGNTRKLVDDIRLQFGRMLDYGATTCWETYPKTDDSDPTPSQLTRSHCHAWSAAPGYFLGTAVLGVTSSQTGWREVVIQPNPCGLTWAKGSVPLPSEGRIDVSWKIQHDGRIHIKAWAPAEVNISMLLPEGMEGTTELHVI
jgi:alpha-L-rhamnosidase